MPQSGYSRVIGFIKPVTITSAVKYLAVEQQVQVQKGGQAS
jgi:hypothetical protein